MQQLNRKNLLCGTVLPLYESQAVFIDSEISNTSSPLISTGSFIPSNYVLGILNSKPFPPEDTLVSGNTVYANLTLLSCKETKKLTFYLTFLFVYEGFKSRSNMQT